MNTQDLPQPQLIAKTSDEMREDGWEPFRLMVDLSDWDKLDMNLPDGAETAANPTAKGKVNFWYRVAAEATA